MINTKHIIIHTKLIIILSFLFYGIEGQTQCLRLNPGSIGSNQTICYNASPAAFTNITSASGGSGSFAYQWQSTTVSGCGSGWGNISGATASTYQAGNLTQTTCYRREVTSSPCGTGYSNTISVTVYPNLTAGSVGSNQSICYNTSPAAFTQTAAPTGGTGSYTYQWQQQPGCSGGWSNISGATATTYNYTGNLTQTTCYRRNVTSGSCGTVSSGAITVTVYANLTAGSVGSNQSICYNTSPAAFTQTAAPSGGTGSYTYQWQSTTVGGCGSGWGNISGATATTYNYTGNLTQTTCYRRNVSSGSCGTVSSVAITVTVYANLTAGSVGSNQSICYNTSPAAFTQVSAPSGGIGSYTYQWQSTTVSGCGSGWGNISGATASTYNFTGNLTQTTCYRRNVTSGSCGTLSSAAITVTVYANLTAGSVGSNQSICYNTSPAAFTQTAAPTGGTGSYTYQWQSTTVGGCGSEWGNISGATATTYQAGNLTQTTCFRRNVTSGSCGTVSSGAITVTVYDLPVADAGSDVSIFMGDSAQIGSSPIGGNTYEWSPATGLSCTNCANPIAFPSSTIKYDVTVTDNNGCSASDRIIIEVNDLQPMNDGVFEGVFDRFGTYHSFERIMVDTTSTSLFKTTQQCISQSGYFNLYFDDNWEGSTIDEPDRRNVICQLFSDLSDFITPANPNVTVNIWIRDINDIINNSFSSNVLGVGSAFHTVPSNASNISGIVDNEIWKTINSGTDSYTNVFSPLMTFGQSFYLYHGFFALNFFNQSYNWHHDLTQQTGANSFDLYTIALHEVMHAMGFASLINVNGNSKLGPNYNYYSRYDLFLKTTSNDYLIQNSGNCSMYNYGFNSGLQPNVMAPAGTPPGNCSNHILFGGNVEQAVYSPSTFTNESSLSHLEDMCHDPGYYNDDQYYVMSNGTWIGPLYMKRYLKEEERTVLCDMGYNVGTVYGSVNNHTFYDQYSGTCDGWGVAGVNDGIINNPPNPPAFAYLTSVSTSPIFIDDILLNDFNAVSFECLEDIYGNGYPDVTSGTSFNYYATSPGLAVLRYIPVAANANRGNITYIYIYVLNDNCYNPDPCNLVNNGSFENATSCGHFDFGNSPASLSCWNRALGSPDIFARNCSDNGGGFNVGILTMGNIPAADSHDGDPNNHFMGIHATTTDNVLPYMHTEMAQSKLNTPLIYGNDYLLSFWAKVGNNYGPTSNVPAPIYFGSTINPILLTFPWLTEFPQTFVQLVPSQQTTVPNDNQWHQFSIPFTFTGLANHNNLIIAYDIFNLQQQNIWVYFYIDDVSIIPAAYAPVFTPPTPLCIGESISDLSVFANPFVSGTFSGTGVTCNGTCEFDASVAGVGSHDITFTYISNQGCTIQVPATIEVIQFVDAEATATATDFCNNFNLNATGATNYVWSPTSGLSDPNIANPIASPTVTTTYTVTVSTYYGCSATDDVVVSFDPDCFCQGEIITTQNNEWGTGFNLSSSIPLYSLIDNVTITGNVVLENISIVMDADISITIEDDASLTLNNCHLYGCDVMWQGIIVKPYGSLIINDANSTGTTLIEDAYLAVDVSTPNTSTQLLVDDAIFNRNLYAIEISDYPNTSTTPYDNFVITNSVFTGRDMFTHPGTSWPSVSDFHTLDNSGNLNEQYSFGSFDKVNLKQPLTNKVASYGVSLIDVGQLRNGTLYCEALIDGDNGNTTFNIYDNLLYGISGINSNFTSTNNVFQNIIADPQSNNGRAIYAENQNIGTNEYQINVLDFNKFYDCSGGIHVVGYNDVYLKNADMRSTQVAISDEDLMQQGDVGIYVRTPYCNVVDIKENAITNIRNGIIFIGDEDVDGPSPVQSIGNVTINSNTVQATFVGMQIADEYALNGIQAFSVSNQPIEIIGNSGQIIVSNNNLLNVHNGIYMHNWFYDPGINENRAFTENNYLLLRERIYEPDINNPILPVLQYGIAHDMNWSPAIKDNYVEGFGRSHDEWYGIVCADNICLVGYPQEVMCNTVVDNGTGIGFYGDQTGTVFFNNTMQGSGKGFVLNMNAALGKQGDEATDLASNNMWPISSYSSGQLKTFTFYSDAHDSELVIDPTDDDMDPESQIGTYNSSLPFNVNTLFSRINGSIIEISGSNTNNIPCASFNKSNGTIQNQLAQNAINTNNHIRWLEKVVSDSISYSVFQNQQHINNLYRLYKMLLTQPELKDSSAILLDFYSTAHNSNIESIVNTSNALAGGSPLSLASSYYSNITAQNDIESKYKDYYMVYFNYRNGVYGTNDSIVLKSLADGCPARDGMAVRQARALYSMIYNDFRPYSDKCDDDNSSKTTTDKSSGKTKPNDLLIDVYPNPSNGTFTITLKNSYIQVENVDIRIYNLIGKQVGSLNLSLDNNSAVLNVDLNNGIYFLTASDANGHIYNSKKILVIK